MIDCWTHVATSERRLGFLIRNHVSLTDLYLVARIALLRCSVMACLSLVVVVGPLGRPLSGLIPSVPCHVVFRGVTSSAPFNDSGSNRPYVSKIR